MLESGGRIGPRDRFVKRVAAVAGDVVALDESGRDVRINDVPRPVPPLACTEARSERADASSALPALPDPEVQARVDALLAAGKIDQLEAAALLREVAPPSQETAEGAIEALQTHPNDDTYEKAVQVLDTYFGLDPDPSTEPSRLVPVVSTSSVCTSCGSHLD